MPTVLCSVRSVDETSNKDVKKKKTFSKGIQKKISVEIAEK